MNLMPNQQRQSTESGYLLETKLFGPISHQTKVDLRAITSSMLICLQKILLYRLGRYIAITNLSIIAVCVEYLRQFLIDLNQIYRHSSVPQNTSP